VGLTLGPFSPTLPPPPKGLFPRPQSVCLAGLGETGPIAIAARALAGNAIDRAAADLGSFRFGTVLDYRAPEFLPGGAKYLDLPGLITLNAGLPLWRQGEPSEPTTPATAWLLE